MTPLPIRKLAGALVAFAAAGCAIVPVAPVERPSIELLITGGEVYDGTGERLPGVEVAIDDGRIVRVAPRLGESFQAENTIDASGLVVAPGFIDPHTHADHDLTSADQDKRANLAFAFQGVTTVVVGNDGYGLSAPRSGVPILPTGTNFAFLSGFGDLRRSVMGMEDRPANAAERAEMIELLKEDFCAGAYGFSAGLYYAPQSYADTEEVMALARQAGLMGGYYDTHIRDESDFSIGLLSALDEAIKIGTDAGIPVHIAHIKALGPAVWGQSGKMISMIEDAQAGGLRITADQYPWEASGTRISNALVPGWALEGGLQKLRKRMRDPNIADRLHQDMTEALAKRGGADKLLVTARLGDAEVEPGRTLADIGSAMGVDPIEAAMQILLYGDARVASFNMNEADMRAFAYRDWVVTGSDGSTGHPRKYASFPKAHRDLVANGQMSLARFIRRSSGQTADIVGFSDRGYLKAGYAADIVIFDPKKFAPRASYQAPTELASGVEYLLVNGKLVIAKGEATGNLPGDLLLKPANCG